MPNTLSVAGSARLSWSLSDGTSSQSKEVSTLRSISNGTGPNQATVAWYERVTATGVGFSRALGTLPVDVLGITGTASVTNVRELVVSVVTGPTGGSFSVAGPAGLTGVVVGVGGQLHWANYVTGATGTSTTLALTNGITGTYTVDLAIVGVGTYAS